MFVDEEEITQMAMYCVIDYYRKKYVLEEYRSRHFKLSNGYIYKVKFNYDQYIYIDYKTLFRGENTGIKKDKCDGYVIITPINSRGFFRSNFLFILIQKQGLQRMISEKMYISDEKGLLVCRYKFSVRDVINNGKLL